MGKYTKKARMTAGVALTPDVSQSYLAVRTHTKTLPLHRASAAAPPPSKTDACYLELRSRRLEKPMHHHNSPNTRRSCPQEHAEIGSRDEIKGLRRVIEASFEDNCWESDDRERCSSPCSLIRGDDTITTSGSTTGRACSNAATQRVQDAALLMNVCAPSARELEEFFAREEQSIQRRFIEKYNFDVVGDLPLPGRYEWVAVRP